MEFDPVDTKMLHVIVNTSAAHEHLGDIKREIRVVKERGQCTPNTLTLRAVPKQVIIEFVYFIALWINAFPEKAVISKLYSPCEIISGHKLDFKLHYRMDFVEYEKVHDEPSLTNSMKSRTRKCLGVGITGNLQGYYKFLNLTTGKILNKQYWTQMPTPDETIKRVECLSAQERRSGRSGKWRLCNCNHERYAEGTEGDDE